mgnify:CR=1 FL=1
MKKFLLGFLLVVATTSGASAADYTVEEVSVAPPVELSAAIRNELRESGLRVLENGEVLCEVWFRKSLPGNGSGGDGLSRSYPDVPDMALLGAISILGDMRDNRDNEFKKGLYTIRHSLQPQDGNHVGASEYIDFAILLSAERDTTVEGGFSDSMTMIYRSLDDGGTGHPIIFAMIPPEGEGQPSMTENSFDRWVLEAKIGNQVIAIEIVGYYEH